MFTSSAIKLFIISLFFLPYAQAASAWVGCILTSSARSASGYSSSQSDSASCISTCTTRGYTYASYVSLVVFGNNCYCMNEASYPGAVGYIAGSAASSDLCVSLVQATTFITSTTYTFSGCYGNIDLSATTTSVSSPRACFASCASTSNAYVMPSTFGSTYTCACGAMPGLSLPSLVCGKGTYYAYDHPAGAAASALPRRKREEARYQAMKRAQMIKERAWDCPRGMKACNVQGVEDSWECVDPYRDLESCGGCANGDYVRGNNATDPTGVDCTSVPGILRGSVTCSDGRCTAFACKRGWALRNGECVRSLSIQL
ncbi:hypothetical protein IAT38_007680 [Cryptococcus sp. DSM 104549]